MKLHKLLALLLTLAMVLPMVTGIVPASAEETAAAEELPTETVPVDSTSDTEEAEPSFYQCSFADESQLADFDLYQSGTSKFVVSDGVLVADGTDGEQKAILNKDVSTIKSVSVNIIPGESGNIYAGLYVGAKNPANAQDSIDSMVFLIKSDYSGWSDAANRIDIVQGRFNGSWTHIKTVISETGNGNNLFTKGNKEPLNLKLSFSEDVILLTLSLVSNSAKNIQLMYEVEPEDLQGSVGLRTIGSDTKFDKLIVNEDYVPETLTQGLTLDGTGLDSYAKTVGNMTQKPVTIEAWVWVPKLAGGSRRQCIITNYTEPTVAKNPVGTWGLYTNEYTTLYYTERTSNGVFNKTLGVPICNNSWNHVAIVRRQGALDVYWNGEFVQTIEHAGMGDTTVVENPMTIGYCSVGAGTEAINSLKGQVGDIRLWSTERTETQIQADMYRELEGTEEGLIQHWNFDSQEKGIVSNTVEGGLDVELLGHTQIGNEEIRRWDFSQEKHLEDFTFYYSPDYTSESYNFTFGLTDEMLAIKGSINNSGKDIKAILTEEIENITYIGADVTQGGTSNSCSGILLGVKNVNSTTEGDYEGIRVRIGRLRTSAAKRPYGEIDFYKANGTYTKLTELVANTTFFPDANTKLPYHIQVELEDNTVNAHMHRLDDPTIENNSSYTFADGELDGQIGFWLGRTGLSYDNITVVSEIPEEQMPDTDTGVRYDNAGHSFHTESRAWKLTEELSAAPYTLEAWVKIPEGVQDTAYGYIVGNASRAPSVSMQMAPGGKLQLSYAVENADDLTVTTNTYDVDTDLRNGKWTHVAYTMDVENDTVVAYINGVAVSTWSDAGLTAITIPDKIIPGNTFAIGSLEKSDDPANKLLGWIADVRMWDRALSASEVQSSMMTQYTTAKDGLMFNAPLNEKVDDTFTDLSGNGYVVAAYDSALDLQTETHEPGSYSMIVIPDQQVLTHYSPERLNALYQWIADNREKENIQIVMNVGDMADNCGNITQWENTRAAWELLPDDLPFIAVPGNHDYDTNSGWNKGYGVREQLTLMNEYLPQSIFESYPTDCGFFDDVNSANQWQAFEVNGNQYLVIGLEYVPQDDVIAWANEVVETHPNHQVILVTHSYVGSYGNLDVPKLWSNFLSKHENVIMAFSGHVWHTNVVRRTDEGVNGNQVHQMLMDAQVSDTGSEGNKYAAMIGILRFNADGTVCDVSYYSTDRDMYDSLSNFTLQIPKQEHKYSALVGLESYTTVTEALANANGETVKILKDTDEEITIDADVTVDLAGCTLSNVTVAEGVKLNLIDSTADYSGTKGSATVTGTVEKFTANGEDKYMVIGENGVYAPHRYYVGLTHVSLDTANTGFGYKARFYGDEVVQAQVATTGYDLWMNENVTVTRTLAGYKSLVTLRLKNFMVKEFGETPVNAKAFIVLKDGTRLESEVVSYSMRSMIELLNESYADFSVAQLQSVAVLIKKHETMQTWNVENILNILKPAATVEAITVENQEMELLDGTTNTFTLNGAYQFTAQDTEQTIAYSDYASWTADYYITMDAEAGEGLYLAGNYGSYGWIAIPVESGKTYTLVPVVQTLLGKSLTYEEMVTNVVTFSCGVADTLGSNAGATVTVELRLTNPEDVTDYITLNSIVHVIPTAE